MDLIKKLNINKFHEHKANYISLSLVSQRVNLIGVVPLGAISHLFNFFFPPIKKIVTQEETHDDKMEIEKLINFNNLSILCVFCNTDKKCINKEDRIRHLPGYCP